MQMSPADCRTNDLIERLCRALQIAIRTVDEFAACGYVDEDRPENSFDGDKPVAEAAMLLYVSARCRTVPLIERLTRTLAERLIPYARSEKVAVHIALHPAELYDRAFTHILLTRLGYEDERFDTFLRDCQNSSCARGKERLAFANIEQQWISDVHRQLNPNIRWKADLKTTALAHSVDVLRGRRLDAYGLTHLFMYCTDFGRRKARLPRPKSVIFAEARSLLAKCLDTEDYDLAAELLAGWPMLKVKWCPASTFCFHILRTIEDEVGVLPGGVTSTQKFGRLEGAERSRYALATGYHTAMVMGLLCAAILSSGRMPDARSGGKISGASNRLLHLIPESERRWARIIEGLSLDQKDSIADLILDIGLTRACRLNDFSEMQELLLESARLGIPCSPLALQSAEMLSRLGALSTLDYVRQPQRITA